MKLFSHVLVCVSLALGRQLLLHVHEVGLVRLVQILLLILLEELLNLAHLEVVEADRPDHPVEVLLQLQVLAGGHQRVQRLTLHGRQFSAHLDLFLDPITVSEVQDLDHELDVLVHLDSAEVGLYLALLLGPHGHPEEVGLEARQIELLVIQLQDLLPLLRRRVGLVHGELIGNIVNPELTNNLWLYVVGLSF